MRSIRIMYEATENNTTFGNTYLSYEHESIMDACMCIIECERLALLPWRCVYIAYEFHAHVNYSKRMKENENVIFVRLK